MQGSWMMITGFLGVTLLLASAAVAQVCVPPPAGMVGWWPGDGNAQDIAGTNNGTLRDNAGFDAGKVGPAFDLDGMNDFVEIPDSTSLKITGAITIGAWVKPNTVMGDNPGRGIVSKYGGFPVEASYLLWTTPIGELVFSVYQNTPQGFVVRYVITEPNPLPLGVFTHVAATFDPATQVIKLYLNGVDTLSPLGNGSTTISAIFDSTKPVRIGAFFETTGVNGFFDGVIDEVDIFNRALTAAEIAAIYNAGSAGKCKDTDGDGIANTVDEAPTTASARFSDTPQGGHTSGAITAKDPGIAVTITDADDPLDGVEVVVTNTGPPGGRARIRLDGKAGTFRLRPGTYIVTDPPPSILSLETLAEGPGEYENGSYLVSVSAGAAAIITETGTGSIHVQAEGNGTVAVNGTPVSPGQSLPSYDVCELARLARAGTLPPALKADLQNAVRNRTPFGVLFHRCDSAGGQTTLVIAQVIAQQVDRRTTTYTVRFTIGGVVRTVAFRIRT